MSNNRFRLLDKAEHVTMADATDSDRDLVSVIIPCRNEEPFIESCLCSVLAFTRPTGVDFEILLMDGRSTDGTLNRAIALAAKHPEIRVLDNPGLIQSSAMNQGIRLSRGNWILRLDAHAHYPVDYLKLCYEAACRSGAENVGGIVITQTSTNSYAAKIVQALTTHRFGVGDSGFRTGAKEGFVDTVPFGFFRRDVFTQIGFFDERLVRAQDYEFNRRIISAGGHVFLSPEIRAHYYNQAALGKFIAKQFLREAPYNAYLWYTAPYAFAARHAITAIFALGVLGGFASLVMQSWLALPFMFVMTLYLSLSLAAAIQQGIRYRELRHVAVLPACFFLYHFLHGVGVLNGVLRLLLRNAPVQQAREPWPGAGRRRLDPSSFRVQNRVN